jgi:hypothetical protein
MPNWSYNLIAVKGEQEELERFSEAVKGTEEVGALDFNKVIPYPDKFKELDKIAADYLKENPQDYANCPKDGYNLGGYEWCNNNWGTKWNACETTVSRLIQRLEYRFRTAWCEPEPIFQKLREMFPKLSFVMISIEEQMLGVSVYDADGSHNHEENTAGYAELVGLCPSTYDLDEDLCDLFNKSEVAE